jgi:hypothetical protein
MRNDYRITIWIANNVTHGTSIDVANHSTTPAAPLIASSATFLTASPISSPTASLAATTNPKPTQLVVCLMRTGLIWVRPIKMWTDSWSACFPGGATAVFESSSIACQDEFCVSDSVQDRAGVFFEIVIFSLLDDSAHTKFVRQATIDGHRITLTPGFRLNGTESSSLRGGFRLGML